VSSWGPASILFARGILWYLFEGMGRGEDRVVVCEMRLLGRCILHSSSVVGMHAHRSRCCYSAGVDGPT
jgi:hypothetical protein